MIIINKTIQLQKLDRLFIDIDIFIKEVRKKDIKKDIKIKVSKPNYDIPIIILDDICDDIELFNDIYDSKTVNDPIFFLYKLSCLAVFEPIQAKHHSRDQVRFTQYKEAKYQHTLRYLLNEPS